MTLNKTLIGKNFENGTTASDFIFWDGEETKDAGYCLFGCSIGGDKPDASTTVQHPYLHTGEMLELLLDVASSNPGKHSVAFAFDYDVNQILCDLGWRDLIRLNALGKVEWEGYVITHIPHKTFSVSHKETGRSCRVDDVFSFFRMRYDKALAKYETGDVCTRCKIMLGKECRDDFWYRDIDYIKFYWSLECQTGCQLMQNVKTMASNAGIRVTNWYGPGAFAAYSLNQNKTTKFMAQEVGDGGNAVPLNVRIAAIIAYAGGWFERFKMGVHDGPVYTYDINSAYVYAMSLLPDLHAGKWTHYTAEQTDLGELARQCRFGLFHTKWKPSSDLYIRSSYGLPLPLFHRDGDGRICRPALPTDLWLWNPEAANCSATPFAEFTEAWVLEDDGQYPFDWVSAMYNKRHALKAGGDPSEKILKMTMASYYGRLAQRTGWDERNDKAPKFHQLEWAGWITSKCRSMIYQAAFRSAIQDSLISVDTDGIISTAPISTPETPVGTGLGEWEADEYTGVVYLQNGVYWLRGMDGNWNDPKLRGIPARKLSVEQGIEALRQDGKLTLERRTFTGYGAALHSNNRRGWRVWENQSITIDACNAGGRIHIRDACRLCSGADSVDLSTGLHDLVLVPHENGFSKAHQLPWLTGAAKKRDDRLTKQLAREHSLVTETLS